jgi:hypothetical protein
VAELSDVPEAWLGIHPDLSRPWKRSRVSPASSPRTDIGRALGSMCHGVLPNIRATWDARYQTPLTERGVIYGTLSGEAELPEGSFVVVPGDPELSAIWQRDRSLDLSMRMPPLGRHRVDTEYIDVLERWISSL